MIEKLWHLIGGRKFMAVILTFILMYQNKLDPWVFMVVVMWYMGVNVYKYLYGEKGKE